MIFREANINDISQIQVVRHAVKENTLSDPALVTDKDCEDYIFNRGKGWVCQLDDRIIAFAIADLVDNNIWALFVIPEFEGRGIGKKLHDIMLEWYFSKKKDTVWLGTAFNTRAEKFYRLQGWTEAGIHGPKEIRFEMSYNNWINKNNPLP